MFQQPVRGSSSPLSLFLIHFTHPSNASHAVRGALWSCCDEPGRCSCSQRLITCSINVVQNRTV